MKNSQSTVEFIFGDEINEDIISSEKIAKLTNFSAKTNLNRKKNSILTFLDLEK